MKTILFFLTIIFESAFLPAQPAPPSPEQVTRAVADNILRHTTFRFINKETGTTFTSTRDLPDSPAVSVESPYNEWYYMNGVIGIAMMRLAACTGDKKYSDYAVRNFDFIFGNLDYFKKQYDAKRETSSFFQYFRLGKLDDCGAMSAALADVNEMAGKKEWRAYLKRSIGFISSGQRRLSDGTFVRPEPRKMTLWADDLYMSVPFLARMGRITGNPVYFADAVRQVKNFTKYLFDPQTGLYFHCWYSNSRQNGVAHWGRSNGWMMLAQVELLDQLPEHYPGRGELIRLLLRQIVNVSRYQDAGGMWHQLLDRPDSYSETSCTAMFTYCIARAVRAGWIDKSYLSVAREGWKGLLSKIRPGGEVTDICVGTGIEDNIGFYYARPRETDDLHGLGPVILAGTEMMKLETE